MLHLIIIFSSALQGAFEEKELMEVLPRCGVVSGELGSSGQGDVVKVRNLVVESRNRKALVQKYYYFVGLVANTIIPYRICNTRFDIYLY